MYKSAFAISLFCNITSSSRMICHLLNACYCFPWLKVHNLSYTSLRQSGEWYEPLCASTSGKEGQIVYVHLCYSSGKTFSCIKRNFTHFLLTNYSLSHKIVSDHFAPGQYTAGAKQGLLKHFLAHTRIFSQILRTHLKRSFCKRVIVFTKQFSWTLFLIQM